MTAHEKTWLVSSRPGQVGACQSSWGVGGYAGEGVGVGTGGVSTGSWLAAAST